MNRQKKNLCPNATDTLVRGNEKIHILKHSKSGGKGELEKKKAGKSDGRWESGFDFFNSSSALALPNHRLVLLPRFLKYFSALLAIPLLTLQMLFPSTWTSCLFFSSTHYSAFSSKAISFGKTPHTRPYRTLRFRSTKPLTFKHRSYFDFIGR